VVVQGYECIESTLAEEKKRPRRTFWRIVGRTSILRQVVGQWQRAALEVFWTKENDPHTVKITK